MSSNYLEAASINNSVMYIDVNDSQISPITPTTASSFFHRSNLTYEPWLSLVILIIAVIMSLATIIGNVLVITAFIIEKSLRKYSNYFILNLSIADLLIGILIPPYAPFLLLKRHWRIGKTACTIWLVLDYVVGSASVLCIVVISLDRYLLVSRGLDYVAKQKVYRAILIMITVWVIAFLNYAPAIIFWEMISGKQTVKEGECQVAFYDNLYYLTATACVEFFAPLISICGLNLAVYLNIKKRSRGLIRSENPQFTVAQETSNNTTLNRSRVNTGESLEKNGGASKRTPRKSIRIELTELNRRSSGQITNGAQSGAGVSLSRSSSTDSSLSLDDACIIEQKKKQQLQEAKKLKTGPVSNGKMKNNNGKNSKTQAKTKNLSTNSSEGGANQGGERSRVTSTTQAYTKYNKSVSINTSRRTLTKDKKAARSLFILVFVFGFCWAPYTFLTLIKSVCPSCVNDEAHEFTFWLLWFNSTLNPIIYPLLHVKFRKAFARILHSVFFCFKFKKPRSRYREVSTVNVASTTVVNNRRFVIEI